MRKFKPLLLTLCILSTTPLGAQESSNPQQYVTREQESQADSHDREDLFPNSRDRFQIVGIAQDDNDFRKKAPALQNSDKVSAQVDLGALRERLLESYAGRDDFSAAIAAPFGQYAGPIPHPLKEPAVPQETDKDAESETEPRSPWTYFGVGIGVLLLAWGARVLLR